MEATRGFLNFNQKSMSSVSLSRARAWLCLYASVCVCALQIAFWVDRVCGAGGTREIVCVKRDERDERDKERDVADAFFPRTNTALEGSACLVLPFLVAIGEGGG